MRKEINLVSLEHSEDKNLNKILENLLHSKFRKKFHLKEKEVEYIRKKGIFEIEKHAQEFIEKRLKAPWLTGFKDGKQTPYKGHPVFIAQHATATCCRKCMEKWHKIPQNKILNYNDISFVKKLIMKWIKKELSNYEKKSSRHSKTKRQKKNIYR